MCSSSSFASSKPLRVLLLGLSALLALSLPSSVSAHGWVSSPPSRQGQCATGAVTNCGEIQYEPQSVEALKGKTTCNGDQVEWAVLADESMPWVVTPIGSGINKFTWTQTAIHVAADWEYWIGSTLVAQFTGTANTIHCVDLTGYSGKQKILAIWNIGDTADAFYSCVDVNIGAGTGAGASCVGGGANVYTPPATIGCSSTTTSTSYIVASGDTLTSIATARGLTAAQLVAVNPLLSATTVLEPGSSVVIPPTLNVHCTNSTTTTTTTTTSAASTGTHIVVSTTGVNTGATCTSTSTSTYSVRAGDSLATIAAAYGTTVLALVQANPSLVTSGQSITLPGTCSVTVAASSSASSPVVVTVHSSSTAGSKTTTNNNNNNNNNHKRRNGLNDTSDDSTASDGFTGGDDYASTADDDLSGTGSNTGKHLYASAASHIYLPAPTSILCALLLSTVSMLIAVS